MSERRRGRGGTERVLETGKNGRKSLIFLVFLVFNALEVLGRGGGVFLPLVFCSPPPHSRKAAKSYSFLFSHGSALLVLLFFAGNLHCLFYLI